MDKDLRKILEKLDILAEKIDVLTMVTAIGTEKEKLFEGLLQKDRIKFLDDLGFNRNMIALMVGTSSRTVSSTLSQLKRKKKSKKKTKQEEKVEE